MSNIKVLHLRSSGGFYGAESVILALSGALASKGTSTHHIACLNNSKNPHDELVERAKKSGLASSSIDCRGMFDISAIKSIRQLLIREDFNVLHCHDYKATVFGFLASIGLGIKRINTNHLWTHGNLKLRLYEILEGVLFNFFDHIVAVSSPVKNEVRPFLINKSKLSVIPNGIDCDRFKEKERHGSLRKEFDISCDEVVIGIIGRQSKQKGHECLFYAFNKLVKECANVPLRLLVVGHGELGTYLKKLADDLGISEKVIFVGFRDDVISVLNSIDIFAMPSLSEGLSIALLEAMAAGVPVVATPVGDIPDLIKSGETGLIVLPDDIDQLKDALKKYICMDDAEKNKITDNAGSLVEQKYSVGIMSDRYEQMYDAALHGKNGNKTTFTAMFIFGVLFGAVLVMIFTKMGGEGRSKGNPDKSQSLTVHSGLLSSFDGDDPISWDGQGIKTKKIKGEQCSDGKCLKVVYPKGDYPGLDAKHIPADWTDFDTLELDIFNPYETVIKFGILVKDIPGGHGYSTRYDGLFALKPGKNQFILNITGLKTNDGSRNIDISQIMDLVIFLVNPDRKTSIYLDNIRLVSEDSNNNIEVKSSINAKRNSSNDRQSALSVSSGVLSSFDGNDIVSWSGVKNKIVLEKDCISGRCLKVTYPKGSYPGLSAKHLPSDWSEYDTFYFDVYNPQDYVVKFGIIIKDIPGGNGYTSRYDSQFAFKPGRNQFVLNITGLKTNDGARQIDIGQVKDLIIFLVNPDAKTMLYFDNIRLERDTGSKVNGMMRYDFGTESSEVWPGFVKVTSASAYNSDLGYGWNDTGRLRADDRRYPDALFRDWVRGNAIFKVDVDNGEYVVYMMIEDPGFWEYYQNYNQRKVFAEGQVVIDEKLLPEEFFEKYYFGHLNYEDLPGRDVFKDYVTKRFVWRKFETKVEDGQLTLQFDSADAYANTLSALIVAPLENDHNVKGYLEGLNSKRKTFFEGLYIESRGDASQVSEGLRKEYLEKGFVPFEKNYNDPMLPSDAPTKSQLTDKISLIVFQNEYEPFVVGFYPLKDVGVLSLSISDLKNSAGQVFSKRNIKMNYVQYKLKLTESHIYTMRGELLRDINKFNLSSGVTRYGWFTVYVPKGTNPGVYKGKVNVVSRGPNNESRIESDFDLEIKILPFELDEPDIPIGLFYSLPFQYDWYPTMKGLKWTAIERQLKDMRDHGINTLALGLSPRIRSIDANGNVELDFRYFDEFLHVYKHFGFNQPVSGYGLISIWKEIKKRTAGDSNLFEKSIVSAFSQIKAHAKMYSGNDIVIVLADEVSNTGGEGIDSIKKVARILKDSGLNATGYFNYKNDREIFPYLRTVTITNGLGISEDLLKYAKKSNTDVWFYNIGQNRFTFGYYLWKTKVKGRLQWHYQLPAVDPYFDLDGRESDYCASYPSFKGPINAVWFELVREGIDDYRYLKTLENLVKTTEFGVSDLLLKNDAKNLLKKINSDISIVPKDNNWSSGKYADYRNKISQMIERIYKIK